MPLSKCVEKATISKMTQVFQRIRFYPDFWKKIFHQVAHSTTPFVAISRLVFHSNASETKT